MLSDSSRPVVEEHSNDSICIGWLVREVRGEEIFLVLVCLCSVCPINPIKSVVAFCSLSRVIPNLTSNSFARLDFNDKYCPRLDNCFACQVGRFLLAILNLYEGSFSAYLKEDKRAKEERSPVKL